MNRAAVLIWILEDFRSRCWRCWQWMRLPYVGPLAVSGGSWVKGHRRFPAENEKQKG